MALTNSSDTGTDKSSPKKAKFLDKILSRIEDDLDFAVYRELVQNSDDAKATEVEIHLFTFKGNVQMVTYRNNGEPFNSNDWSKLKDLADNYKNQQNLSSMSNNFNLSAAGLGFGVSTMFSVCDEPQIMSGNTRFDFFWKDDVLCTKSEELTGAGSEWTSFVLTSRKPYASPDVERFGEALCASLVFAKSLMKVSLIVDNEEKLTLFKTMIQGPTTVKPPKAALPRTSIWKHKSNAVVSSPNGYFSVTNPKTSIKRSVYKFTVALHSDDEDKDKGKVKAEVICRFITTSTKVRIPNDLYRDIEKITGSEKMPPAHDFTMQLYTYALEDTTEPGSKLHQITRPLFPQKGDGKIYVGYPTKQTTGLGMHVMAPFIPTIDRDAISLRNPFLRQYNTELLEYCGIITRLNIEHSMSLLESDPEVNYWGFKKSAGLSASVHINTNIKPTPPSQVDPNNDPTKDDLTHEERQACLLMRPLCLQQSKPDPDVGVLLQKGFTACMPNVAPPVLTCSGFARGSDAALPCEGIEQFVKKNAVSQDLYDHAEEYHFLLARCRCLNLDDLSEAVTSEILQEDKMALFIKWWAEHSSLGTQDHLSALMDNIRFYSYSKDAFARDLSFYIDNDSLLAGQSLPLPESVIPQTMQEKIGLETLKHSSLNPWFSAMPMEIWTKFIGRHQCMSAGLPEDEHTRLEVLRVLSQEFSRREDKGRSDFGNLCQSVLYGQRCMPFDSSEPTIYSAECPSKLYLSSSNVKPFEKIGIVMKASCSLKYAEVSDEFLLALGVQKNVCLDYLFSNLKKLEWIDDPKPLIDYLNETNWSEEEWEKLRSARYLPAENTISSRLFAPSELYLPDPDLRMLPFTKLLQWPSEEDITEDSIYGKFLMKVGIKCVPKLTSVLRFLSKEEIDDGIRIHFLKYICNRLDINGPYYNDYEDLIKSQNSEYQFISCVTRPFLSGNKEVSELHSPWDCYLDIDCAIMEFPVIHKSSERNKYSKPLQCASKPPADALIQRLLLLAEQSRKRFYNITTVENKEEVDSVLEAFNSVFKYLSSRIADLTIDLVSPLRNEKFIPVLVDDTIEWHVPEQAFFKNGSTIDVLNKELFKNLVDFSEFLAFVGVRDAATPAALFRQFIMSPDEVLKILGSKGQYLLFLRHFAENPPFEHVTDEICDSPFLFADSNPSANITSDEDHSNCQLAKAEDIYIVDNLLLGRMFPVFCAPIDSVLEEFYRRLGSQYISQVVKKSSEVPEDIIGETPNTQSLRERIDQRCQLLTFPGTLSKSLSPNVVKLLYKEKLSILEAKELFVVHSLGNFVHREPVSCCYQPGSGNDKSVLYVTQDYDWFDVGHAIGDLILEKCELADALSISSLLEATAEKLRKQGFPVDMMELESPMIEAESPNDCEESLSDPNSNDAATAEKDGSDSLDIGTNVKFFLTNPNDSEFPSGSDIIESETGNSESIPRLIDTNTPATVAEEETDSASVLPESSTVPAAEAPVTTPPEAVPTAEVPATIAPEAATAVSPTVTGDVPSAAVPQVVSGEVSAAAAPTMANENVPVAEAPPTTAPGPVPTAVAPPAAAPPMAPGTVPVAAAPPAAAPPMAPRTVPAAAAPPAAAPPMAPGTVSTAAAPPAVPPPMAPRTVPAAAAPPAAAPPMAPVAVSATVAPGILPGVIPSTAMALGAAGAPVTIISGAVPAAESPVMATGAILEAPVATL